jgi:hypothetical protein
VGKSVYRRQRKAGMGRYLHIEPFILALDPFYGLTSNFSCPYNLLFGDFPIHCPLLMLFLLVDKHCS